MALARSTRISPRECLTGNHSNKGFTHEGDESRALCAAQKNMVVVCRDRHWQYASVDPKTGLREYNTGPTTDAHVGGWSKDKKEPEHNYLNMVGGFLEGAVDRRDGRPALTDTTAWRAKCSTKTWCGRNDRLGPV